MAKRPKFSESTLLFSLSVIVCDVRGRDEYRRFPECGKLRYRHGAGAVYHDVSSGKAHRHIVDVIDKFKIRTFVKTETVELLSDLRVVCDAALVQVVNLRVL